MCCRAATQARIRLPEALSCSSGSEVCGLTALALPVAALTDRRAATTRTGRLPTPNTTQGGVRLLRRLLSRVLLGRPAHLATCSRRSRPEPSRLMIGQAREPSQVPVPVPAALFCFPLWPFLASGVRPSAAGTGFRLRAVALVGAAAEPNGEAAAREAAALAKLEVSSRRWRRGGQFLCCCGRRRPNRTKSWCRRCRPSVCGTSHNHVLALRPVLRGRSAT